MTAGFFSALFHVFVYLLRSLAGVETFPLKHGPGLKITSSLVQAKIKRSCRPLFGPYTWMGLEFRFMLVHACLYFLFSQSGREERAKHPRGKGTEKKTNEGHQYTKSNSGALSALHVAGLVLRRAETINKFVRGALETPIYSRARKTVQPQSRKRHVTAAECHVRGKQNSCTGVL